MGGHSGGLLCVSHYYRGLVCGSSLKGWPGNTNSAARVGLALDRV
ncbi:hypothetical protein ARTSIC4J27_2224 [Pseudarthrobacter siccitolerans]|uniref:Uncharacterized protein n=1 Tax=Pseudarthrobacter siccitolerans TaxID=861266 RepID=A0A024H2Z7_9MICC|nr:hypothetical protein ARTSIC4J27_2224 [Pseudarthrobacter siccitolerans]